MGQSGNPADSFGISQWQQAYHNRLGEAGYKSRGAQELTEGKLLTKLRALLATATKNTGSIPSCIAARDGFALTLLWATGVSLTCPCMQ